MKAYCALLMSLCMPTIYAADSQSEAQSSFDIGSIAIELLQQHPEHIDTLCKMWHETGGYKGYPNFEDVKAPYTKVLEDQMKADELPLALIALSEGKPIGLCALRPSCIPRAGAVPWSDENPDKKPWFAIFVATAYQKSGVGTKLFLATARYAQNKFGYTKAFVVPEDEGVEALYMRKGCIKIADTTLRGKPAPVLEIDFSNAIGL